MTWPQSRATIPGTSSRHRCSTARRFDIHLGVDPVGLGIENRSRMRDAGVVHQNIDLQIAAQLGQRRQIADVDGVGMQPVLSASAASCSWRRATAWTTIPS
ncbi:Uncharacterised protein [Raoultella planticola]|uniref:Uncharacterized protein n=1 Tax=Raoultella planticola TaxID=575 RepID=A0A485D1M1_RAOPL|nr:Uncharacterised protein [Raoultella planticola]